MPRSVHDNFVLGYTVDCEAKTILIRTAYLDGGANERTNVRFEGVLGYLFRDGLQGILFDIEEEPLQYIVEAYAADFKWGANHGWPLSSVGANESPIDYVAKSGAKAFRVSSRSMFEGFVIAKSMVIEDADAAEKPLAP